MEPALVARGRIAGQVLGVHLATDTTVAAARLTGELDRISGAQLTAVLDQLRADDYLQVVLDVSGLQFLDAGGLDVLVRADARFRERGGRLVLTHPTAAIARILTITGLEGLIFR